MKRIGMCACFWNCQRVHFSSDYHLRSRVLAHAKLMGNDLGNSNEMHRQKRNWHRSEWIRDSVRRSINSLRPCSPSKPYVCDRVFWKFKNASWFVIGSELVWFAIGCSFTLWRIIVHEANWIVCLILLTYCYCFLSSSNYHLRSLHSHSKSVEMIFVISNELHEQEEKLTVICNELELFNNR